MLFLEEPSREMATSFFRGDAQKKLTADLPPVLARWVRAAALGANADSDAYPEVTSDADLATRRERLAEVFREQGALLAPVTDELAARELVAVVADPEGVIVASRGGGPWVDSAARVRLVEGAKWSEDVRGTNAIGTALIERQPVAVVGAAHFERRNHGIFCYGTPIFDGFGDLVAVLDVTGPMERHDRAVGLAVRAAATSLEQALRRLTYARSGTGNLGTVERLVARSGSASFLVDASGAIRVVNDRARVILGVGADDSLACERVFGIAPDELFRLALARSHDLHFETGTTDHRIELDALTVDGRPFAVIVTLENTRSTARTRQNAIASAAPHRAFDTILGEDAALLEAKRAATQFARTPLPVLLLAETGTGKELFARAIHEASDRASGPFVALNCGALPAGVLESELFGHAPGAFTGASRVGTEGKIGAADGGTLFLDEIAEMPDAVQAALLRVLDDGVHYRVGESRPRRSSFRLLCATCRDLPALVERGAFRRDLFFRVHGACVMLPALRHRTDRLLLANELLRSGAKPQQSFVLASSARQWIAEHAWPGNVRELKTALVHAAALAGHAEIEAEHFPRALVGLQSTARERGTNAASEDDPELRSRASIVSDAVMDTLRASAGNVSEAARRLGIARSTVYRALRSRSSR